MLKKISNVILVGGFHEVIELCELNDIKIVGIIDNHMKGNYLGYEIIGSDEDANRLCKKIKEIPLIIAPDQPKIRKEIIVKYIKLGYKIASLISSRAMVSRSARIGIGAFIQSHSNISANVVLNDFVRVNTMANIMHDSIIGEFTTIAPNAVILGKVKIGSLSYIGSNATILPGVSVGNHVIIGAGAVVTKNVPDGKIFIGNPAHILAKK